MKGRNDNAWHLWSYLHHSHNRLTPSSKPTTKTKTHQRTTLPSLPSTQYSRSNDYTTLPFTPSLQQRPPTSPPPQPPELKTKRRTLTAGYHNTHSSSPIVYLALGAHTRYLVHSSYLPIIEHRHLRPRRLRNLPILPIQIQPPDPDPDPSWRIIRMHDV